MAGDRPASVQAQSRPAVCDDHLTGPGALHGSRPAGCTADPVCPRDDPGADLLHRPAAPALLLACDPGVCAGAQSYTALFSGPGLDPDLSARAGQYRPGLSAAGAAAAPDRAAADTAAA